MTDDLTTLTIAQLLDMADGCTEQTCQYHGAVNRELHRRHLIARGPAGDPADDGERDATRDDG